MTSTEDKMIKIATQIVKHQQTSLGEISKECNVGNPLIRGVIRVMNLAENYKVTFGGKKIKVQEVLQVSA